MTRFSFLFKFPSFNYPSLPNATEPDYGIKNLIIFLKISVICFFFTQEEKQLIKIFGRC